MNNDAQVEYWNGPAGAEWVRTQERLDAVLAPLTPALLDVGLGGITELAAPRIVDVGCGCGTVTLEIAQRVRSIPGATVTGVDVSEPMLGHAESRRPANLSNVSFRRADAGQDDLGAPADRILSRLGVMFFADPPAAFAHLRASLAPEGRLTFVCWQGPKANPWLTFPLEALLAHLPPPEPPAPGAPGPFGLSARERLEDALSRAGFPRFELESLDRELQIAGSVEEVVAFYRAVGPSARLLREAEEGPRERAIAALRDLVARHHDSTGLRMPAAAWLVSGSA